MGSKNVFLTTISEIRHHLDIDFFLNEDPELGPVLTTGISVAEAGIKFILARHAIDQIIVIGPPNCASEEEMGEMTLSEMPFDHPSDIEAMTDYAFLRYRLQEFMHQLDFEILDVNELLSEADASGIMEKFRAFRSQFARSTGMKDFFITLCTEEDFARQFYDEFYNTLTRDGKKYILHYLFSQMDSFYKMHLSVRNRKTKIRYLPIDMSGMLTIQQMAEIMSNIIDSAEENDIHLYMDTQGMDASDGNTLISTFLLFNNRVGYNCTVEALIETEHEPGAICGRIENVRGSYDILKLVSGVDLFLEYGKDDRLKEYWQSLGESSSDVDRLFSGMDLVDEGISLCVIDLISAGIEIIRRVILDYDAKPAEEKKNVYLDFLINAIRTDYGDMLDGDALSIPALLSWSFRKGFYQQTLTIIESKVPGDMVKRGIYYYAENQEDLDIFLKAINMMYWNTPARLRYSFNDMSHYFIKNYGRDFIDYRQSRDDKTRIFAQARIDALYGKDARVAKSFSQLGDDKLLYELLHSYYTIGNMRNDVNHAMVDTSSMAAGGTIQHKDCREDLDIAIENFIRLYTLAANKTQKTREVVLLEDGALKTYTRNHELKPLDVQPDLTQRAHFCYYFNGSDLQVDICLLKPEKAGSSGNDRQSRRSNSNREGSQRDNRNDNRNNRSPQPQNLPSDESQDRPQLRNLPFNEGQDRLPDTPEGNDPVIKNI